MVTVKRLKNILKYGLGDRARERKQLQKMKARDDAFHSALWNKDGDLVSRTYESYDAYVSHQADKLGKVAHRLEERGDVLYEEFYERFARCEPLRAAGSVLCLAARVGTEVRAMQALGYFCVGIDLNPGPNNPYVLPGDFHDLVFPDGCVDAVYCNSIDHVFDLERMIGEVGRVLRPGGLFIAEILAGYEEGTIPGEYEATHWPTVSECAEKICHFGGFETVSVEPLGKLFKGDYTQVVLRKPVADNEKAAQPKMRHSG